MADDIVMSASPLVKFIEKDPAGFQREDLVRFVEAQEVRYVHFRYPALDGKLKELRFSVNNRRHLDRVLAQGERVDGSSLFPGIVDPARSDIYVVPVYKSAFLNPFSPSTLDILCRFFNEKGEPVKETPDNILAKSHEVFEQHTGLTLQALGEAEFYLAFDRPEELFPGKAQGTYHESGPFIKGEPIVHEILDALSKITGKVKYCHAEVGYIQMLASENPILSGKRLEQHEVEFLPAPLEDMASFLLIAKWVIRNISARHGVVATFAPKLDEGDAGNGMHFHLEALKDGRNAMTAADGSLSETALRIIGGLLKHARGLTAFGNTVSASFLRLMPHQEAPTRICWSESNRSVLVRVPLGWRGTTGLDRRANPAQTSEYPGETSHQTVEFRAPDGSADVYLLLAGFAVAARSGLADAGILKDVERLHVSENIDRNQALSDRLEKLPGTCAEAARALLADRKTYEEGGVFAPSVIDYAVTRLLDANDANLWERLSRMSKKERLIESRQIMHRTIHQM